MEFVVITGMSGAGKTQASHVMEDMGYYCIDNMPSAMIPYFAEVYSTMPGKSANVAFIIDVRGESDFQPLLSELARLKESGYCCRTVFIDCEDRVLINRYKETRRVHPLVTLKNVSVWKSYPRSIQRFVNLGVGSQKQDGVGRYFNGSVSSFFLNISHCFSAI